MRGWREYGQALRETAGCAIAGSLHTAELSREYHVPMWDRLGSVVVWFGQAEFEYEKAPQVEPMAELHGGASTRIRDRSQPPNCGKGAAVLQGGSSTRLLDARC